MALLRDLLFAIFASYTIFGVSGEHLIQESRPTTMCGRNLPSILDALAFTDWRKRNSTLREEPPKMVTFREIRDSPCNIDHPQ